jgi:hypothetical protein
VALVWWVERAVEEADDHSPLDMRHHPMAVGYGRFLHLRDEPGRCRERDT